MDGKSIMGLLLLAASQGTGVTITADGPDEDAAIAALCALIERGLRRGAMRLTGLGVSPGIGIGKALVLKRGTRDLQLPRSRRPRAARARAARGGTPPIA